MCSSSLYVVNTSSQNTNVELFLQDISHVALSVTATKVSS